MQVRMVWQGGADFLEIKASQASLILPKPVKMSGGSVSPFSAMEAPVNYPPIKRCVTPEDRVAIIIDSSFLGNRDVVEAVLNQLVAGGVVVAQVSLVINLDAAVVAEEYQIAFPGVVLERHDSNIPEKSSYLATLRSGRRVYMSRALVEADTLIMICTPGQGSQGKGGHSYIGMLPGLITLRGGESAPDSEELAEIANWLPAPYMVLGIDGPGGIIQWWAGATDADFLAKKAFRHIWRSRAKQESDLVVIGIGSNASKSDFRAWCRAVRKATRLVKEGGQLVLLAGNAPDVRPWHAWLEQAVGPGDLLEMVSDMPRRIRFVREWAIAGERCHLRLLSNLDEETVSSLFAEAISLDELKRMLDKAESVAAVGDISLAMVGNPKDF